MPRTWAAGAALPGPAPVIRCIHDQVQPTFRDAMNGKLRKVTVRTATLILALVISGPAVAEITISPAARGYDIDITGQTSSAALIDALAGAIGAKVEGYPPDSPVASGHLRNASIERALRTLLPTARFIVRFDADDTPAAIIFLSSATDGEPGTEIDDATDPGMMQEPELQMEPDPNMAPDVPMEPEPSAPMESEPAEGTEQ